ncbi:hypothetical protein TH63_18990 [Rufibacter radiotolerans]|uniref:Uncharacterized protein n=1 Tax=Rufibacter radiotolerans TaxID=1379910 RepID=A0A0H4VTI0_9BACT|nr:hypothetical protein [Rufibacter radiotolerans]AKQ47252.1 hypothetical protein TH63_18990 [Rufibacter radiotolerans]
MKKILALVFLLLSASAGAQSLPGLETKPFRKQTRVVSTGGNPLLILGAQETDYASLVVDPKDITVVKAYQDSAILAAMGPKARYGVLVIELKNKKPLLKLEDVFDYFEVPAAHRHLQVLVNQRPITHSRFLAHLHKIEKVEVIQIDKAHPIRISWDENAQFLNIVTKK